MIPSQYAFKEMQFAAEEALIVLAREVFAEALATDVKVLTSIQDSVAASQDNIAASRGIYRSNGTQTLRGPCRLGAESKQKNNYHFEVLMGMVIC